MLHAKFQDHRTSGSGVTPVYCRILLKVYSIYGRGCHLGHVAMVININFRFPFPRRLHRIVGFDWPSGFRGEDI